MQHLNEYQGHSSFTDTELVRIYFKTVEGFTGHMNTINNDNV